MTKRWQSRPPPFKKILTILLQVSVLFSAILFLCSRTNIQPYIVLSGSMEPAISTGSLVFVNRETGELKTGDIITFRRGNTVVTHRIARFTEGGFITKGDANRAEDPGIVTKEQVLGAPAFFVPWLGYAVVFLKKPGTVAFIIFCCAAAACGREPIKTTDH